MHRRLIDHQAPRRAVWILVLTLAVCVIGGLAVWLELNSPKESPTARITNDAVSPPVAFGTSDAFNKMSPGEHLVEAKKLLESPAIGSGAEAVKHLHAIPTTAPEYSEEQTLENRAFVRMAREWQEKHPSTGGDNSGDRSAAKSELGSELRWPAMLGGLVGIELVGASALLYLLPIWVGRKKRNIGAIVALDLLLGWTFIGWVGALVWALTNDAAAPPVTTNQASPPSPVSALLCVHCGKYSRTGSKFCDTCGTPFAVV